MIFFFKMNDTKIVFNYENDINKILENLKNIYEDKWKKNNEINTSIKLPKFNPHFVIVKGLGHAIYY